jgi:lipoprotein-anchoring transpeptidase ErfK/SrfK
VAVLLKYGMVDPAVKDLRARLNGASTTRLPRLALDTSFDIMTMARVMEYQSRRGLATDGVVGPKTHRSLNAQPNRPSAPLGRCVVVDLINNQLYAFESGAQQFHFLRIKGGSTTDPSDRGVFKVRRRLRYHTSSQFPEPPGNMDFSLFYNKGEALHQGPTTAESHGCIHVRPVEAEQLFNWAGQVDLMVIVVKLTR